RNHPALRLEYAKQADALSRRELRNRDDPSRSARDAWQKCPAVRPRPGIERLGMTQDSEVVEGDDQWHARADGRAEGGAVENVCLPREQRQSAEVPADVADRYGGATSEGEGVALQPHFRRS